MLNPLHFDLFRDSQWRAVAAVPPEAIASLNCNGTDPNTSTWDEGVDASNRNDAILRFILTRSRLSEVRWGSFWDGGLTPALQGRFQQAPLGAPFEHGGRLHFQLEEPGPNDYASIALGMETRAAFDSLEVRLLMDMIEDALEAGLITDRDIRDAKPGLYDAYSIIHDKRLITAEALYDLITTSARPKLIDIRNAPPTRISTAVVLTEKAILDHGQIPDHKRDKLAIIYCQDGKQSKPISRLLRESGCKQIRVLAGGMDAWTMAGYPTVT